MIHRIFSDLPSFKNIQLHEGLNILLSEREASSTNLQTRNRAGKSSLIHTIHFIMGATAYPNSLFRNESLKNWHFGIEFDLGHSRVTVERSGQNFGRIIIRHGDTSTWPIQPTQYRNIGNSLSANDWCTVLGKFFFGLSSTEDSENVDFAPTFRSLFSYFARRENEGGFRRPESQSTLQQIYDQQIAIAYLLGLDWRIPQSWESVRQREKTLKELKKAAQAGAFGSIISTSAQLRTELILADQSSQRLHDALSSFEVLPEYNQLETEASQITRDVNNLSNENTLDEQLLADVRSSFESETPPDSEALFRIYQQAGVILTETVIRRFDDVKNFHESVISNRRNYLSRELDEALNRMRERRSRIQRLDERRGQIMRLLQTRGALEHFERLQQEASRQDAKTESVRQRFQAAEQLEGTKTQLDIERANLLQNLRLNLSEQAENVSEAIGTFESISHALYEQAGSLTLSPTENGLKTEVRIQGQLSRGIQNMKVFCFDLMLMKLCSNRKLGPGFLVHDSHIFDGVDERQVARALQLGSEIAASSGWQYLVTMNSDDVPSKFPVGFDFSQYLLPVRLTDATENGGLFGFRF